MGGWDDEPLPKWTWPAYLLETYKKSSLPSYNWSFSSYENEYLNHRMSFMMNKWKAIIKVIGAILMFVLYEDVLWIYVICKL